MEYVPAKTILQSIHFNGDYWFGINYSMNLYIGCCHGCIYCDSRSDCYHIIEFDRVRIKENCLSLLRKELPSKRKTGVIGIGAMSDHYNIYEKDYELTRNALKLMKEFGFGVSLETKSKLVTRDIDVIKDMQKNYPCIIKLSISTADDSLARIIEPNASLPSERFQAIRQLSEQGIFCGVLLIPVLPFITDTEENIKKIVQLAYENGAKFVFPKFGVTLRQNQRSYYYAKLNQHFPGMADKYIKTYGDCYEAASLKKDSLWQVFSHECKKKGLMYEMKDIVYAYKYSNIPTQLSFFL